MDDRTFSLSPHMWEKSHRHSHHTLTVKNEDFYHTKCGLCLCFQDSKHNSKAAVTQHVKSARTYSYVRPEVIFW